MRSKLLVPAIVLLAAAFLAFGLCRWTQCAKAPASMDVLQDASWLSRQLHLSPGQVAEVWKLQQDLRTRLENCESMSCAARCQLGDALFSDTNGTAKATALVEAMCKAQAESERATLEHIQSVHRLLNTEQQKRYEELVSRCVCSTCQHEPSHTGKQP
jgi:hypothetical protein